MRPPETGSLRKWRTEGPTLCEGNSAYPRLGADEQRQKEEAKKQSLEEALAGKIRKARIRSDRDVIFVKHLDSSVERDGFDLE